MESDRLNNYHEGVLPTTLHEKMKRLGLVKRANGGDDAQEPEPDERETA